MPEVRLELTSSVRAHGPKPCVSTSFTTPAFRNFKSYYLQFYSTSTPASPKDAWD